MSRGHWGRAAMRACVTVVALLAMAAPAAAQITVSVVDDAGKAIPNGFRWQLEEDNFYGI